LKGKEAIEKKIIFVLFFFIAVNGTWAEENGEIQTQTDLTLVFSTVGDMQFGFEKRFVFSFLQGTNPMTADNNITLKIGAEVTPISFDILADVIWMPIAFFKLSLGSLAGTGWNYEMFDSRMNGMGLYRYMELENPQEWADGYGFDGAVWKVHFGATLQFDLAAIFPGDWNHVVMKFENFLNYQNYTRARGNEQWYFKADDGINQNSFSYYFSGFLGYQMPIFFDMVGIQFESSLPFYNPQSGESLADRKQEMFCSLVTEFQLGKCFNIMAITQFSNRLKHPVTEDYERQWKFYRVLFIGIWHLDGAS
jgi:hypothetical protein